MKYEIGFQDKSISISTTPDGFGRLVSNLKEDIETAIDDNDRDSIFRWNLYWEGIESMILAHACAGIDVSSDAYIRGVETAYDAYENNF